MKKTISLVLVLALGLATNIANADFTFGTPTNLGPTVNSSVRDSRSSISSDGLELYFESDRSGGYGDSDLYVATRLTPDDPWDEPVNLGPVVNSSARDRGARLSADNLSLFLHSNRPEGSGGTDLWVATRPSKDQAWIAPVNVGPMVNSSANDAAPSISADGLELFFHSPRSGGLGGSDLYVATRATINDGWGEPINLGANVNSSANEYAPNISPDRLTLYLSSTRSGGYGSTDMWMTRRARTDDVWGTPVNLGPTVNSSAADNAPAFSADGSMLYFHSRRTGGFGDHDLWQASIEPVVDLNSDGIVDAADMCIMVDHWGTDEPLCDIGPMPWGDGIVDVKDLIVLAEHLFEGIPPVEVEEVHVDADDDGSQVELEQGRILVVTLESNPTTGYRWEQVENQESILEQMGEAEFKPSDTGEPPLIGAGGWEIFRFKAISAGRMTLQLVYHRPWEEGVEPVKTFSIQVVVN
jgi:predicted secreted protein